MHMEWSGLIVSLWLEGADVNLLSSLSFFNFINGSSFLCFLIGALTILHRMACRGGTSEFYFVQLLILVITYVKACSLEKEMKGF